MSALYRMVFQGVAGEAGGVLYIGRNKILGMDTGQAVYEGFYTEQAGRLRGTVTLTASGSTKLITGQVVPQGTQIPITFNLPLNFTSGTQTFTVGSRPVQVIFTKIGDIP